MPEWVNDTLYDLAAPRFPLQDWDIPLGCWKCELMTTNTWIPAGTDFCSRYPACPCRSFKTQPLFLNLGHYLQRSFPVLGPLVGSTKASVATTSLSYICWFQEHPLVSFLHANFHPKVYFPENWLFPRKLSLEIVYCKFLHTIHN